MIVHQHLLGDHWIVCQILERPPMLHVLTVTIRLFSPPEVQSSCVRSAVTRDQAEGLAKADFDAEVATVKRSFDPLLGYPGNR